MESPSQELGEKKCAQIISSAPSRSLSGVWRADRDLLAETDQLSLWIEPQLILIVAAGTKAQVHAAQRQQELELRISLQSLACWEPQGWGATVPAPPLLLPAALHH